MKVIYAFNMDDGYFDGPERKLRTVVKTSLCSKTLTGTFVVSVQTVLHIGLSVMILTGTLLLSGGSLSVPNSCCSCSCRPAFTTR